VLACSAGAVLGCDVVVMGCHQGKFPSTSYFKFSFPVFIY
jgi:hypothetical protein